MGEKLKKAFGNKNKILFLIIIITITYFTEFYAQDSPVRINEVMFYPAAANSEFVELINVSESDFDLSGHKIIYAASPADIIIPAADSTILPAGTYGVIFEGDYPFGSGIYDLLIPAGAVIMRINNNAFGSNGMSNSSDRAIFLISPQGDTLDSYIYTADNSEGISDEKIIYNGENSPGNWANSIAMNGSPGGINSVSPRNYDLLVSHFTISPLSVFTGEPAFFSAKARNNGLEIVDDFQIDFYYDSNNDAIFSDNEKIYSENPGEILPGDSLEFQFTNYFTEINNDASAKVEINCPIDENLINNSSLVAFKVVSDSVPFGGIVISEIMYDPDGYGPEWIELNNTSDTEIHLEGWKISDKTTHSSIDTSISISPGKYIVISDDESIVDYFDITGTLLIKNLPSLNNTGDDLKIISELGRIKDSVNYHPDWGGLKGYSLEKIDLSGNGNDPENWTACSLAARATPGKENSVIRREDDIFFQSLTFPFSPPVLNEIYSGDVSIGYTGRAGGFFTLNFGIDLNRDSLITGSELLFSKVYSVPDDGNFMSAHFSFIPLIPGLNRYIARLDREEFYPENNIVFVDLDVKSGSENRFDIVINEFLFAPASPNVEWVEIYNTSAKSVNLKNYSLRDRSSSKKIINTDQNIMPGDFVAVAKDSIVLDIYPNISNLIICEFPSLNNTGDLIILKDSLARTIDSLEYFPDWDISPGISLERVDALSGSNTPSNWLNSTSVHLGTPGRKNSVTSKEFDVSTEFIKPESEYLEKNKAFSIEFTIKNLGDNPADGITMNLFNDKNYDGLLSSGEIIEVYLVTNINPEEVRILEHTIIPETTGLLSLGLNTIFPKDEFEDNNNSYLNINVVLIETNYNDIVINEIMHSPSSGEPEWIELYNLSASGKNLNGFIVSDGNSDAVLPDNDIYIPPKEYLVICEDSTIFSKFGNNLQAIILPLPSLNNSGDLLVLKDSLGRVIDSVEFRSSWGGTNSRSLERIDPAGNSLDSSNWKTNKFESGATPGRINSVSKKNYDLLFISLTANPSEVDSSRIIIQSKIKNSGFLSTLGVLKITGDTDGDDTADLILPISSPFSIEPDDSLLLEIQYDTHGDRKNITFFGSIVSENDEDTTNNNAIRVYYPFHSRGILTINEIMFAPLNGEPEWFELLNSTSGIIDISGWQISDLFTSPTNFRIIEETAVYPGEYFVITKDSSIFSFYTNYSFRIAVLPFPNLNNDRDGIVIRDIHGKCIDSVHFNAPNAEAGRSLERIDTGPGSVQLADNFSYSEDKRGGTPGRINSVSPRRHDFEVEDVFLFPEFPQPGEETRIHVYFRNNGAEPLPPVNYEIRLKPDTQNEYIFHEGIISADPGLTESIVTPTGFNFSDSVEVSVNLKTEDEDSVNNKINKTFLAGASWQSTLISEIMYYPAGSNAEWIELKNQTADDINISGWSISGTRKAPEQHITDQKSIIPAGGFYIISSDTSRAPSVNLKAEYNFGSLGNSGGHIYLFDNRGFIVDSCYYSPLPGRFEGRSLERLNNSPESWFGSISDIGHSCGQNNSLDTLILPAAGSLRINEIMYEPSAGNAEFVEIINTSLASVNLTGVSLSDNNGDRFYFTDFSASLPANEYYVLASDSNIISRFLIENFSGKLKISGTSELSLTNTGKKLFILDIAGNIIDSLQYSPKWHNPQINSLKDRSLEKISPATISSRDTWTSSVASYGGTPLKQNSVYTKPASQKGSLTFSPNPFSPDNDGFEDFMMISYNLNTPAAEIHIKIFDSKGRLRRSFYPGFLPGNSGGIIYDGLDDNQNPLPMGIYIMLFEAAGSNGVKTAYKQVFVVARRL